MVKSKTLGFGNLNLFYLDYGNDSGIAVMLLHGYHLDSDVWLECGTLDALKDLGAHAYALDVPGFPNSRSTSKQGSASEDEIVAALEAFVDSKIGAGTRLFLLGASAGGHIALKFGELHSDRLEGLILSAPSDAGKINIDAIKTKMLVVLGDEDREVDTAEITRLFEGKAQIKTIKGAGHKCYLDAPAAFNRIITRFIESP